MFLRTFLTSSSLNGLTTATTSFIPGRSSRSTRRRTRRPRHTEHVNKHNPWHSVPLAVPLAVPLVGRSCGERLTRATWADGQEILPKCGGNGAVQKRAIAFAGAFESRPRPRPVTAASPRLTFWERVKYTLVRPDDDPSRPDPRPRRAHGRRARGRSAVPTTRSGQSAWWRPRSPRSWPPISSASIDYARSHNQSLGVYDKLTYVFLGLAALILVSSLLRKRLFQGITLALFGLAVFHLHYWGFGVPFLLAGAWYLVRAYRLQQALKRVQGGAGGLVGWSPPAAVERNLQRVETTAEQALHAPHLRLPPG